MSKFSFKRKRAAAILSLALAIIMLPVSVFAQAPRPTDVTNPSSGNVIIKVELRALSADKQAILNRVNAIRREACNQRIKITSNGQSIQLTPSSYKEIKWSSQLEEIALTRAAEANLLVDHKRPNGKWCYTTSYQGFFANGESLAWIPAGDECVMRSIELWYKEKENVGNPNPTYLGGQTGHYFALINPNFTHFAVAGVHAPEAKYRNCVEGAFLIDAYAPGPVKENQIKKEGTYSQLLEVPAKSLQGVRISGKAIMTKGERTKFSLLANRVSCTNSSLKTSQYNNVEIEKSVTWGTENAGVATVDTAGNVTAQNFGSTNITAKVGGQTYKFNVVVADTSVPAVQYRAGIQGSASWQSWKQYGLLAGSTGQGLRMEGLQVKLPDNKPYKGGIRYNAQIQTIGWQGWKADGQTAGFNPQKTGGKRLESIKIELTGEMAEHYDVWYHMHTQRFGWMGWAKNGEPAGTVGYAFRVEAIEVALTPKGSPAPANYSAVSTPDANMLSYVRTNSYDNKKWQGAKGEGDVSGTRGQKKTAITMGLSQSGIPDSYKGNSGITYRVYQDGKWTAWVANDKVAGKAAGGAIQGLQVKLTGNMAQEYDVYYRVEIKNGSKAYWMDWTKNGLSAGYKGKNLEQIQVAIVPKGDPAPTADNNAKQRFVLKNFPRNTNLTSYGL